MERYEKAKDYILGRLQAELSSGLYYHGFHHVLDVLSAADMLGRMEKITPNEMELLRIAVLFHDSGFIVSPKEHEARGCDFARTNLPDFGYSNEEIKTICGMIMATKYPQQPKNHLEEIICDADLDYLGRDDFFEIGNTLFKELNEQGVLSNANEWNNLQEEFLLSHKYFTRSATDLRKVKKEEHLNKIREGLKEH
jgi:uncharacterized protein